jgi:hypothetical protein
MTTNRQPPDPYCRFKTDKWLFWALAFRVACATVAVVVCAIYLGPTGGGIAFAAAAGLGRWFGRP